MKDPLTTLIELACIAASLILGMVITTKTSNYQEGSYDKITKCQEELPRTQHCVLIAVPDEVEE